VSKGMVGAGVGVLLGAALFLAACGSQGGSSDTVSTAAVFVKEGNQICRKWQKARAERFAEAGTKLKPSASKAERDKVIVWIFRPYGTAIDGLSELAAPSGDEKKVEAVVQAMEKAAAEVKAHPAAAVGSLETFKEPNQLAEQLGLKECIV
jgi:hypothetical protein